MEHHWVTKLFEHTKQTRSRNNFDKKIYSEGAWKLYTQTNTSTSGHSPKFKKIEENSGTLVCFEWREEAPGLKPSACRAPNTPRTDNLNAKAWDQRTLKTNVWNHPSVTTQLKHVFIISQDLHTTLCWTEESSKKRSIQWSSKHTCLALKSSLEFLEKPCRVMAVRDGIM